ncbi:putative rmlC-like cupin domain superfamily, rmlC-like jelly roll protein [Helianthus debilis subsp. tardiflorus]
MASKATNLLLAFSLLFATCIARQQQQQKNQCQIQNIEALEPIEVIQAEAGVTEIWDANDQQFQCAGVDFIRHRIQPGGLLLPSYVNTPILAFVERGRGIQGIILSGCPETYEYSQEQQLSGQSERRGERLPFDEDRHQKVENLNEGDVVAIPTGTAHWIHNDGNTELVVVVFFDTQNNENQLDEYQRVHTSHYTNNYFINLLLQGFTIKFSAVNEQNEQERRVRLLKNTCVHELFINIY